MGQSHTLSKTALHVIVAVLLAFLVVPILAVIPSAFSEASYLRMPPENYSTRWFTEFFADKQWSRSLMTSLRIAVLSTIVSVVLGTLAAVGLQKLPAKVALLLNGLFLAPMIVPVIVTAVALYFAGQRVGLVGTELGMVLGHSLLCIPFVVINVGISLRSIDPSWLRAAEGLGASGPVAFRTVTLPNILPGLLGGGVFAFITSFDEVIISIFLSGYATKTLPVKMWEEIRLEFTPVVAVGAVLMIALTLLPLALHRLTEKQKKGARE
ncbi:ABC transporter permease [Rhodobacteraceae bacterium]|nr:ABC transporter permease [Paracoccaceae bacterium]